MSPSLVLSVRNLPDMLPACRLSCSAAIKLCVAMAGKSEGLLCARSSSSYGILPNGCGAPAEAASGYHAWLQQRMNIATAADMQLPPKLNAKV